MQRTQIYLEPTQLQFLKNEAHKENASVSEILRKLVNEFRQKTTAQPATNFSSFLETVKTHAFSGGPQDLASNLDKYLYGETDTSVK